MNGAWIACLLWCLVYLLMLYVVVTAIAEIFEQPTTIVGSFGKLFSGFMMSLVTALLTFITVMVLLVVSAYPIFS